MPDTAFVGIADVVKQRYICGVQQVSIESPCVQLLLDTHNKRGKSGRYRIAAIPLHIVSRSHCPQGCREKDQADKQACEEMLNFFVF